MEGKINFACLDDNSKELDYGTIDRDIEAAFYSSKLVIDFSKDDSPTIEQQTYRSPTKRIEFETSRQIPPQEPSRTSVYDGQNTEPEFRTRTTRFNQIIKCSPDKRSNDEDEKEEVKQKRKQLLILYLIGLILVIIGIALIIVGAVSNHTRLADNDATSAQSLNFSTQGIVNGRISNLLLTEINLTLFIDLENA